MSKTVLVLTGTGQPARAAANIYAKSLSEAGHDVHFAENTIGPNRILAFFWKRLRRYGLHDTMSVFWLRLRGPTPASVPKAYEVDTVVNDPDELTQDYLTRIAPDLVIANACALLSPQLIERLHGMGCAIINVHNGLNPRYRGTGNVWAIYERNFDLTGVTLHHLDAGIDTGKTIAARHIDFLGKNIPHQQIDVVAFEEGARMAVDYVILGSVPGPVYDVAAYTSRSRAYTYPSWRQYFGSKARYDAAQTGRSPEMNTSSWQESFRELATEDSRDVFQRQHWGDSSTIEPRDQLIQRIVIRRGAGGRLLDIGCGDGRYRDLWDEPQYWGCDFSLETMTLGGTLRSEPAPAESPCVPGTQVLSDGRGNHFVEAAIGKLPVQDEQMSTVLGIGLMQHLDNTGAAADDILRVLAPGGQLILNTLRQPSWLELIPARLLGLFRADFGTLARAIWQQDYFRNLEIAGTKLARRYTLEELRLLFAPQATLKEVHYGGILGTRLLSREITVVFEKNLASRTSYVRCGTRKGGVVLSTQRGVRAIICRASEKLVFRSTGLGRWFQ